jgi:hypothetical protein
MTDDVKLAIHLAEQAEKHAELGARNPDDQQFHLDSIMELIEGMAGALGTSVDELNAKYGDRARAILKASSESDPEEAWRQERGR